MSLHAGLSREQGLRLGGRLDVSAVVSNDIVLVDAGKSQLGYLAPFNGDPSITEPCTAGCDHAGRW